ncbi:DinB family protein [Streptomyces sp. VRA16 Mangrove soil]|uniref:DinB family protein n=1 Tax=Streptomyces sp. VRA16 Mangrove soil TaxID=2817434 RepID=UPI001A9D3BD9|nr:DinB family protein [Streptomyces sp. VRA16 Mangrove soil]MBO1333837.1 DinB family protein [Streptomyces sp. VRA16 Mangrove soil]
MVMHVNPEARGDERGALLAFIAEQRGGLRRALIGLTDEQASSTPSASTLSLVGLAKHVAQVEEGWIALAGGPKPEAERTVDAYADGFRLLEGESVKSVLDHYADVARRTEEFFRAAPSLDDTFPLPDEPWFPDGQEVSLRWLGLHLIRETARHAGHADIVRESLDGRTAFELVALDQQ